VKSAALLAALVAATLAQQWDFEVVDSGSLGNYVAIDRMSDGTLWLAYVNRDSAIRLACRDSAWTYQDLDTSMVRPNFQSWPPFSFDIGPGDVIGVVGSGRLAERRDSVWSSEELPMPMRDCAFSHDPACRPSLTFKDSLWQGCFGLKTDSGWDTNVVYQDPSGYTIWFGLTRPAWRRNDNCAFMEADWWSMGGLIDGYDVSLYRRDSGVWTSNLMIGGLDGGGCGFAALADSSDTIHTFWSASDPHGTDALVCDHVRLDGFTEYGTACLDTAGRVQCAWFRDNRLKFAVPGKPTQTVTEVDDLVWCDITTDNLSQPVIAYWRDGWIVVAHGVDVVGQSEEPREPTANGLRPTASVIGNVLFLPANGEGRTEKGELLDITGRKALDLRPGANDVSRLSPGVYFVRSVQTKVVRKVLLAR
jgi:hypothetical protein